MATSVRGDGVTGGPFIDSSEIVAGFCVIEAPDLGAAVAIARTNPVVRDGGGVDVRPVHSNSSRRATAATSRATTRPPRDRQNRPRGSGIRCAVASGLRVLAEGARATTRVVRKHGITPPATWF